MRRIPIVAAAALTVVALMGSGGCRPDDTIDPVDTTVVVSEYPDTSSGIWGTDTVGAYSDPLLVHQEQLEDVFFDYDSHELSPEALETLMQDAAYIMDNPGFRVLVEGHCDERGTIDYNLALGQSRALAVYDYLVDYGVSETRLDHVSYGKERPFDPGHNEAAWARNRRAHLRVLPSS